MRGKRRVAIAAGGLLLAGMTTWMLMRPELPEPVYQGKPLSYWLKGYDSSASRAPNSNEPAPPGWADAQRAVQALGTNAVPPLMKLLRSGDSKVKEWLWRLLQKQHFLRVKRPPRNPKWSALRALHDLGPAASNAVSGLIEIFQSDLSPFGQTAPLTVLDSIGPPAKDAVPALVQHGVTHTNWTVRRDALVALQKIHPEAWLVVPVFVKCLYDPDEPVRVQAAHALGTYGPEAREAVPPLLAMYLREPATKSKFGVWSMDGGMTISIWLPPASPAYPATPVAKNVLARSVMAIDPEAAAKANVTVPDD